MGPAGSVAARVLSADTVSVDLGEPDFRPHRRYRSSRATSACVIDSTLPIGAVEFGAVSMGNPHAVIPVDSVEHAPVGILGPALQKHPSFPQSVNVGFMQRESRERVRLRVYERGVGETLACGTGAAAAVAVGRLWGELGR